MDKPKNTWVRDRIIRTYLASLSKNADVEAATEIAVEFFQRDFVAQSVLDTQEIESVVRVVISDYLTLIGDQ